MFTVPSLRARECDPKAGPHIRWMHPVDDFCGFGGKAAFFDRNYGKETMGMKYVVNRVARPGNREEDAASVHRYTHIR